MRWLLRLAAAFAAILLLATVALLLLGGAAGTGRHAAGIELNAPATAVFAHLVQPELLPKWVGGLRKSEPVSGGVATVGSKSRELVGDEDEAFELESTILKLEPNKLLGVELRHAEFVTRGLWVVKERGPDRSVLVYEATTRYQHPSARLFVPILMRLDQRKLEEDLLRLKALVEVPLAPAIGAAAAVTSPASSAPEAAMPAPAATDDLAITSSDAPTDAPSAPNPPTQTPTEASAPMEGSPSPAVETATPPLSEPPPAAPAPEPEEEAAPPAAEPAPANPPSAQTPAPESAEQAAPAPPQSPPPETAPSAPGEAPADDR